MSIDSDDNVIIRGQSYASRSIGDFVSAINDTPYFGGTVTLVQQESKPQVIDGVTSTTEVFELKGKIKNYDMRSK
jgi:hypothetical protein